MGNSDYGTTYTQVGGANHALWVKGGRGRARERERGVHARTVVAGEGGRAVCQRWGGTCERSSVSEPDLAKRLQVQAFRQPRADARGVPPGLHFIYNDSQAWS